MKNILIILFFIPSFIFAQTTNIPDPNFEQALIDLGYDNIMDGSVLTATINSVQTLNVAYKNINDLTGIQEFTDLVFFYCGYNNLTSLDVSNNLELQTISCENNMITSLDLSNNSYLSTIICRNNQLVYLNAKNGNNYNINFWSSVNNPDLTCIAVDDPSWSSSNWFYYDWNWANFDTNCPIINCYPDNSLNTPGFYPPINSFELITVAPADTFTVFPYIHQGEYYSETLNFLNWTDTIINYNGIQIPAIIDSLVIVSVSGIPSGLNFTCNPPSCSFTGASPGCINISGITNDISGNYPILIDVEIYGTATVFGITVPSVEQATIDYFALSISSAIFGCMDNLACNYDSTATSNDGSCVYANQFYDCNGLCINDINFNGICDELEIFGCTDSLAINYDPLATQDDSSCEYCQTTTIDSISTNVACIDDIVTIYGSNLCAPMNVHLQGWSIPSNLIISSTSDSVSFIAPSVSFTPYIVQLRFIDSLNNSYYTNTLPFTITNLSLSLTSTDVTCYSYSNGTATASVSGGTSPYLYYWDYNSVTDPFTMYLPAGSHTCYITDANGCADSVIAVINEPAELQLSLSSTDVSCNGLYDGSVVATAINGVPPYQYSLGAALSQSNGTFTNLNVGTYYIDVTDVNGCSLNQTFTISEPPLITTSNILGNDVVDYYSTESYSISMTISSSYEWFLNGGGILINNTTNLVEVQWGGNNGTYELSVIETDSMGCVGDTVYLSVEVKSGVGLNEVDLSSNKTLSKVVDILGREIPRDTKNQILFYIYNDGTVEKRFEFK